MAHGGARPGAGRKPRGEKFERPINRAESHIAKNLVNLMKLEVLLAQGEMWQIWPVSPVPVSAVLGIEESQKLVGAGLDPKTINTNLPGLVYKRAPDRKALEYCLNRIMGKPVEQIEQQVTVDTAEALIEMQAMAMREVLDNEFGAEVSAGLSERIQTRFAELLVVSES